jgi:hypothetical protein
LKKKYIGVDGQILLTPSFSGAADFVNLIEDFSVAVPSFSPSHWGVVEPINLELTAAELREFLSQDVNSIMWKRKAIPKGWGVFRKRTYPLRGPQFASHALEVSVNHADQVKNLVDYFRHMVGRFGVEYAICDSTTEAYKAVGLANGFLPFASHFMIPTHRLMKCVPDVAWSQVFGPAYVKLIGRERLLSAPAYKVEAWGDESVYIQLSESIFDLHERFYEVDVVRKRVKSHLDDNVFFDPKKSTNHAYRVPQFQFVE